MRGPSGDVPVAQPLGDQDGDLPLPSRQPRRSSAAGRGLVRATGALAERERDRRPWSPRPAAKAAQAAGRIRTVTAGTLALVAPVVTARVDASYPDSVKGGRPPPISQAARVACGPVVAIAGDASATSWRPERCRDPGERAGRRSVGACRSVSSAPPSPANAAHAEVRFADIADRRDRRLMFAPPRGRGVAHHAADVLRLIAGAAAGRRAAPPAPRASSGRRSSASSSRPWRSAPGRGPAGRASEPVVVEVLGQGRVGRPARPHHVHPVERHVRARGRAERPFRGRRVVERERLVEAPRPSLTSNPQ